MQFAQNPSGLWTPQQPDFYMPEYWDGDKILGPLAEPIVKELEESLGSEIEPAEFLEILEKTLAELGLKNPGDILTVDASGNLAVLPVGENGQILTADSTEALGMFWGGPTPSPEGNNGDDIPEELAQWVVPHLHLQTIPDDNQTVWERSYNPPSGTDLLVIFWAWCEGGAGATVRPSFSKGEPDYEHTQLIGNRSMGVSIWKTPGAGTISVTLNKTNQSYLLLPVSVKNQGGESLVEAGHDSDVREGETAKKIVVTVTLQFAGVLLAAWFDDKDFNLETDPNVPGTILLNHVNDAAGAEGLSKLVVSADNASGGENTIEVTNDESGRVALMGVGVNEEELP